MATPDTLAGYGGRIDTSGGVEPFAPDGGILDWLRQFGGWPGPSVAREVHLDEELLTERARSGPVGIRLPWFLPYFDDQQSLGETQSMRMAYRLMLASPEVKAAFLGKVLAVASLDIKVMPADRKDSADAKVAEFVRWNLEQALEGGIPELIWNIVSGALIDGYSVSEKVWYHEDQGEYAGRYCLRSVKPKDTGKDVVLVTDEFRNIIAVRGLRYNAAIDFSPANFLIFQHLPLWSVPTGMSDFRGVYSSWWMLDTVKKLRAQGLDKRSLPLLLGTFQTPQQQPSLAATMAQIRSRNWMTVPEGVRIDALNIAGMADSEFASAIQSLKHEIFLGIQGAILQALEGTTSDGRGNSMVHRSTADLFIWYLSQQVQSILNDRRRGLVKDIVDLNYAPQRYPRVLLSAVDGNEIVAGMQTRKLVWEMGVPQSLAEIYDMANISPPDPDDKLDSLGGKADQEAQVAASTLLVPHGPGVAGAADGIIADRVLQQQGVTGHIGPGGPTVPGARMVEGEQFADVPPGDQISRIPLERLPADIRAHLDPDEAIRLRTQAPGKLREFYDRLPSDQEFAAAAMAGRAKLGWYADATRTIANLLPDDELRQRFVSLIAATSPQTGVRANLVNSVKLFTGWIRAREPGSPAAVRRLFGIPDWQELGGFAAFQAVRDKAKRRQPLSRAEEELLARMPANVIGNGFIPESHGPNVITALTAEPGARISGDKIESFRRNLMGDLHQSTNDVWMAYFGGFDDGGVFASSGNYLAYTAKIRKVARQLGWKPAEVQETVWSYFREMARLQKGGRSPEEALRSVRHEGVAGTEDYATLLARDPDVQRIAGKSKFLQQGLQRIAGGDGGPPRGSGRAGGSQGAGETGPIYPGKKRSLAGLPSAGHWDAQLNIAARAGSRTGSISEPGEPDVHVPSYGEMPADGPPDGWDFTSFARPTPPDVFERRERRFPYLFDENTGLDAPTSTGAVADTMGRRQVFVQGRHVANPPALRGVHAAWMDPRHAGLHRKMSEAAESFGVDPHALRTMAMQQHAEGDDPLDYLRQQYRAALIGLVGRDFAEAPRSFQRSQVDRQAQTYQREHDTQQQAAQIPQLAAHPDVADVDTIGPYLRANPPSRVPSGPPRPAARPRRGSQPLRHPAEHALMTALSSVEPGSEDAYLPAMALADWHEEHGDPNEADRLRLIAGSEPNENFGAMHSLVWSAQARLNWEYLRLGRELFGLSRDEDMRERLIEGHVPTIDVDDPEQVRFWHLLQHAHDRERRRILANDQAGKEELELTPNWQEFHRQHEQAPVRLVDGEGRRVHGTVRDFDESGATLDIFTPAPRRRFAEPGQQPQPPLQEIPAPPPTVQTRQPIGAVRPAGGTVAAPAQQIEDAPTRQPSRRVGPVGHGTHQAIPLSPDEQKAALVAGGGTRVARHAPPPTARLVPTPAIVPASRDQAQTPPEAIPVGEAAPGARLVRRQAPPIPAGARIVVRHDSPRRTVAKRQGQDGRQYSTHVVKAHYVADDGREVPVYRWVAEEEGGNRVGEWTHDGKAALEQAHDTIMGHYGQHGLDTDERDRRQERHARREQRRAENDDRGWLGNVFRWDEEGQPPPQQPSPPLSPLPHREIRTAGLPNPRIIHDYPLPRGGGSAVVTLARGTHHPTGKPAFRWEARNEQSNQILDRGEWLHDEAEVRRSAAAHHAANAPQPPPAPPVSRSPEIINPRNVRREDVLAELHTFPVREDGKLYHTRVALTQGTDSLTGRPTYRWEAIDDASGSLLQWGLWTVSADEARQGANDFHASTANDAVDTTPTPIPAGREEPSRSTVPTIGPWSQEDQAKVRAQARQLTVDPAAFLGWLGFGDNDEATLSHVSDVTSYNDSPDRYGDDVKRDAYGVEVSISHPKLEALDQFIGVDREGKKFIHLNLIRVHSRYQKEGFGAELIASQIDGAIGAGFEYISLHAAGRPGGSMNGYYTWPRFGWDEELSSVWERNPNLAQKIENRFPQARSVLDIMKTAEGREWWKSNGGDLYAARFDLREGSLSRRVLEAYLQEKNRR